MHVSEQQMHRHLAVTATAAPSHLARAWMCTAARRSRKNARRTRSMRQVLWSVSTELQGRSKEVMRMGLQDPRSEAAAKASRVHCEAD